jgi:hypothetical protein
MSGSVSPKQVCAFKLSQPLPRLCEFERVNEAQQRGKRREALHSLDGGASCRH